MIKLILLMILSISLQAVSVPNGKVVLLKFDKKVTLRFEGKVIPVLKNPVKKGRYYALIPINYKSKKEHSYILADSKKIPLYITEGKYKKEQIKVARSKVKPDKKSLRRIKKEYEEAYKIYDSSTHHRYWNKPFILPLHSHITSAYGNARMFNHTLRSFHSGTDFRAKIGTKVKAANDGVIVIAKKRYYAGGSVVIDHGEGLYSCYYHLSRILVHKGEKVKRSQIVGLSGKSGRVNGPHLHFGIRLYGLAVDPIQFEKKINSIF